MLTPSTKSSLARNVLSNWLVTILSIGFSLFVTPILLHALNAELYGVWSFLNGLIAYSDLFYLGLGSALVRFVAKSAAERDQSGLNRLASVVLSIYCGLGLFCCVSLSLLAPYMPRLFAHPLAVEAARATTVASVLLGVQLSCLFLASGFAGILAGYNRFDLVNLARVTAIGVRFVMLPLIVNGPNPLVRLAGFLTITTVGEMLVLQRLVSTVNPVLRLRPVSPTPDEFRLLYGFGVQSFLVVFAIKLVNYADTTVIAFTLGAASVSLYVLPLQIVEYARIALLGFTGVLLPRLSTLSAQGDLAGLRTAYSRSIRFAAVLGAFLLTNVVFLAVPFLNLWVGPEFGRPARWVVCYLAAATFVHLYITIVPFAFYQAMNRLAVAAKILLIEALANLLLSIVLARRMGITGVALATLLPAVCISFMVLPNYLCRQLGLSFAHVFRVSVVPAVWVGLTVAAVSGLSSAALPTTTYLGLCARALLTAPPAATVAWWCCSSAERGELSELLGGWLRA